MKSLQLIAVNFIIKLKVRLAGNNRKHTNLQVVGIIARIQYIKKHLTLMRMDEDVN